MPKPSLPCPIKGPFIIDLDTARTRPAEIAENGYFRFQVMIHGRKIDQKKHENHFRNSPRHKLFLNDDELYFFLKNNGLLENYNLENWTEHIYFLENSWLYDTDHKLSVAEIDKFYQIYNELPRINGIVNWRKKYGDSNRDLVLGYKERDGKIFKEVIEIYDKKIESNAAIAVMPSHTEYDWGISGDAAKELSKRKNCIDCSELLYRFEKSPRQRGLSKNQRVPETHFTSIRLNKRYLHLDKNYYILDDVTTSGTSLNTVKTMLKLAGVDIIRVMALGNTLLS